ncbi:hypothetical protein Dip518_001298 [Parelusimicrobium proximum]|uniref:hypothetical protein n=1 Tax=Parelusimicrobium proximum TaxID=3228953 RepID=UPI003D1698EC
MSYWKGSVADSNKVMMSFNTLVLPRRPMTQVRNYFARAATVWKVQVTDTKEAEKSLAVSWIWDIVNKYKNSDSPLQRPISEAAGDNAVKLLKKLTSNKVEIQEIAPSKTGCVAFTWSGRTYEIILYISAQNEIIFEHFHNIDYSLDKSIFPFTNDSKLCEILKEIKDTVK